MKVRQFKRRDDVETGLTTKQVLSQVVQGGASTDQISVEDMRTRIKVLDALDEAGDVVTLSEDSWVRLVELLNNFKFVVAHRDILAVVDDVMEAGWPDESGVEPKLKPRRA